VYAIATLYHVILQSFLENVYAFQRGWKGVQVNQTSVPIRSRLYKCDRRLSLDVAKRTLNIQSQ